MTSIALADLVVERGTFRLGPLSLELESGSRTALVGPSGSGKTTLLRCVAGLDALASGEVRLDGASVGGAPGTGRGALSPDRRGVGFVFQRGALWPHMTAEEHLRFVAPALGKDGARALLARVGLGGARAGRKPAALSGGEVQRLSLARALAPEPSLLLLDEPLASVDAHLRYELALLIRDLAEQRGLTVVVVTHDRDEALSTADRLAVLNEGRLVEHGSAAELLSAPRTAPTAAFLARATCLAAEADGDGRLRTVFGSAPRPPGPGPWSLVLMPGDVVAVEVGEGGEDARPGVPSRVVRCEPSAGGGGFRVHAALAGRAVELVTPGPMLPGQRVSLVLRGEPRVLPDFAAAPPS